MIANSSDVARLAGVSRATVSQVLNGHAHRFAPQTAERVYDAARELEYQPSSAGRALTLGSSDIVLALIPNATFGATFQGIFEALTAELAERGLTLLLRLSTPETNTLKRVLTSIRPRAVLTLTRFTNEERTELQKRGILTIETPAPEAGDPIGQIASAQVRHLFDRGHRRLAFAHLRDERQELYGKAREAAFRAECASLGLPNPNVVSLDLTLRSALEALQRLQPHGVGVACYNDDVATALLAAGNREGWSVPDELALIGLDHSAMSQLTTPPLTTIEYDLEAVAVSTTAHAVAVLDGMPDPRPDDAIELRLIQGGTTAPQA